MTERSDGGPARLGEIGHRTEERGVVNIEPMSLRDWFAGQVDVSAYSPIETFERAEGRKATVSELADYIADIRLIEADALLKRRDQ